MKSQVFQGQSQKFSDFPGYVGTCCYFNNLFVFVRRLIYLTFVLVDAVRPVDSAASTDLLWRLSASAPLCVHLLHRDHKIHGHAEDVSSVQIIREVFRVIGGTAVQFHPIRLFLKFLQPTSHIFVDNAPSSTKHIFGKRRPPRTIALPFPLHLSRSLTRSAKRIAGVFGFWSLLYSRHTVCQPRHPCTTRRCTLPLHPHS